MKTKILIILIILISLGVVGVVFSLDKFAEAGKATYDGCVWVCGVKRDFVNCLRKCEMNYKSSAMACPGDCWTTIGQDILYECGNVCGTELVQCTDKCYKDWDNTLKDTYYAEGTGRAAKPIPGADEWEVECRGGYITRTYDYSGCVEKCKEEEVEFVVEEPTGGKKKPLVVTLPEEILVIALKEIRAFASSTGITGVISFSWIVGPIVFLIIVGVVIYFFLKKKKLPRLKTRR